MAEALRLYILTVFSLVIYGTLNHLFQPKEATLDPWKLKSFSLIQNLHKLLLVKDSSRPDGGIAWFKMFLIMAGVSAHIMCCLESPIGFFVLSHHKNFQKFISNPILIPLFQDAGIVAVTALGGFTTFMFAFPMAKSNQLSLTTVPLVVVDKAIRFLPAILSIMALDMAWYLPFDGPFVNRVSKVILEKCSKTWWKTALFVNNLWGPSIEIVSNRFLCPSG